LTFSIARTDNMDVERMISLLEENQEKATRCRTCLGMIPNEDNVEWMKNTILSRLHDMEVNIAAIRQLYSSAVVEE